MSKSPYGAVTDWATDFDHVDPEYNKNASAIWSSLRAKCPMAHTERYGGAWLPLSHEMVRDIAYDTEHFSSEGVIVTTDRPTIARPVGAAPPITSDPPFHTAARRLLLPAFSGKRIALLEDDIRNLCRDRLNKLLSAEEDIRSIDASNDYARHIPMGVICKLMGLPAEDEERLFTFVSETLEDVGLSDEELAANRNRFDDYLDIHINAHRENPRDDLISYLIDARLDDQPLGVQHLRGTIGLMFVAGLDTTWSVLSSSLWHLATHPADLERLVNDPSIMDLAVEEFLRAYAPVTMARLVVDDYDFHGHALKKNDWMFVSYPAANRDPEIFEDPEVVQLDRKVNRHSAFGLGIHRCLGSNLARLELKVAIQEFIQQFPQFELVNPEQVEWSKGQVRGPRRLELAFPPRKN